MQLAKRERLTRRLVFLLLLIVIAAVAILMVKLSTPYGLGMVNDSAEYVGGAVDILHGYGYSRRSGGGEVIPISHFPPMFSIVLALMGLTGINIIHAAWLVVLLLVGINTILVGISLLIITRRYWIALLGAFLFASSEIFLRVQIMLLSEPLFITFGLLSSLFFSLYFSQKQYRWLFISGLSAGFAALTRYAGLSLFVTAILTIFLIRRKLKPVFLDTLIYLSGSLPLVLAWDMRNLLLTGTTANRQLLWHPPAWEKIKFGLKNLISWSFPYGIRSWLVDHGVTTWLLSHRWVAYGLILLFGLALMALFVYSWTRIGWPRFTDRYREAGDSLFIFNSIYLVVYIGSILATMSLFDASTLFENRILAPMEISLLIVVLAYISRWTENRPFLLNAAVVSILLIYTLLWAWDGWRTAYNFQFDGLGFASHYWRNSPTIEYIRNLPPDKIIYTNKPTGVFLLTGRNSYRIPAQADPVTLKPRSDYEDELRKLHRNVLDRKAVLIIFSADQTGPEGNGWVEDLRNGLTIFKKFPDSEVYNR